MSADIEPTQPAVHIYTQERGDKEAMRNLCMACPNNGGPERGVNQ